jgi:Protein of unknown function (DUF2690)
MPRSATAIKRAATVLATAALSCGTVVAAAAPGHAAIAACVAGKACGYDGLSPVSTGCANGAYAVGNVHTLIDTGPTGNLNLMYSPTCNTNWVEADGLIFVSDLVVWNTAGNQHSVDNVPNNGGYGYTAMVNGAYDAGGCIENNRFFYCVGQPAVNSHPPYGSF